MQHPIQRNARKIVCTLFFFVVIFIAFSLPVLAFELPKPLSQQEKDRLREIGRQNAIKYGALPATASSINTPRLDVSYFKGPKTTNISTIKDLTNVESFVLDTSSTFIITFSGKVDLTNAKVIQALTSISTDWKITRWQIIVPEKWWKKYTFETPIYISYSNPALTSYEPSVVWYKDEELNPKNSLSIPSDEKSHEFEIQRSGVYIVKPRIKMISPPSTVHEPTITVRGYSSHKDVILRVYVNSERIFSQLPLRWKVQKSGSFSMTAPQLKEGENTIIVLSTRLLEEPQIVTKMTITYKPYFLARVKNFLLSIYMKTKQYSTPQINPSKNPKPTPQIQQVKSSKLSLSSETRQWLIAAGGILSFQNKEGFEKLTCTIPVADIRAYILKDWWGVTDRKSTFSTLDWLEKEGHRSDFIQIREKIEFFTQGDKTTYEELREELLKEYKESVIAYDFAFQHLNDLKQKSLIAWDFARQINIARWAYSAGFISEEEAWSYMYRAGIQIQKTYSSWDEFAEHYVLGRTFWANTSSHPETRSAINWLLTNKTSPWKKISWDQKLDSF